MSLQDIEFQITYDTGDADRNPVVDFLEPCLRESITYDRLSGYFSSRVFSLAAAGMCDFLAGNGKMRLVMSTQFTPQDFAALTNALETGTTYDHLFDVHDFRVQAMASIMEIRHQEAMCWLLAKGRLEIRVVVFDGPPEGGHAPIYHPKIGIFRDADGNQLSFSGSVNETASGWTQNMEEFKVFRSWDNATSAYVNQDIRTFERHWSLEQHGSFRTVRLPEAIRNDLIQRAPHDAPNIRTPRSPQKAQPTLRDYQLAAVDAWQKADHRGILEMATGTGKTKTARECIKRVFAQGPSLVVVTAPYDHIAKQWLRELEEYGPILAGSGAHWRDNLSTARNRRQLHRIQNVLVIAVQKTAGGAEFQSRIGELLPLFDKSLLVGDEVHGLGATAYQGAMNPEFEYRLGLSATPERYFDELGTQALIEYFEGTVFSFSTHDAMQWIDPVTGKPALCGYKYFLTFVSLSEDERSQVEELTESIGKAYAQSRDFEANERLELLLFQRAAVIKTAAAKLPALREMLAVKVGQLAHTLVYCHSMEQLSEAALLLADLGIPYQKITGEESTSPNARYNGLSERDWILNAFSDGTTKVLLAIKCLDEGVDIPAARRAFILASSGNPREFIQRRGRLLRPAPDKAYAEVYDFVVVPELSSDRPPTALERATLTKELDRVREFAVDAMNADDVYVSVAKLIADLGDK